MPWKESSVMEERLRFVARLLDGETMTDMCREFGISRKTGYPLALIRISQFNHHLSGTQVPEYAARGRRLPQIP